MTGKTFVTCILAGMLILSASSAQAQVNAAVSGTVQDASGSSIAGAAITVTSVETGRQHHTTTDRSGNYSVLSLPLGATEVKAEKAGFKTVDRSGITLQLNQNAQVNFQLQVGEFVSRVNVSEQAPSSTRQPNQWPDWLVRRKSRICR